MTYGVSSRTRASAARVAIVAGLALSLGACSQSGGLLMSEAEAPSAAKIAGAEAPRSEAEMAAERLGKEHAQQPRSAKAALAYARSLKALDRKQEALGVLQSSYLYNAQDREYLSEFGRLALDQGHAPMAQQLLERADDPVKPDWRILSARGVALAQQGQYKAAIPFLERARALAPTQPSVANNLALVYTMDGQAAQAEPMLRQANASTSADPRVRQNLALVLQLQGKQEEATRVAMGDDQPLPASAAPASIAARPAPAPERVAVARPVTQPAVAPASIAERAAPAPQPAVARKELPPVRAAAARTPAPSATPAASADPEDVIRAAIQAEVAREQERSRAIATSSVSQR
jgi:Flp pilus assembly protein TadD